MMKCEICGTDIMEPSYAHKVQRRHTFCQPCSHVYFVNRFQKLSHDNIRMFEEIKEMKEVLICSKVY